MSLQVTVVLRSRAESGFLISNFPHSIVLSIIPNVSHQEAAERSDEPGVTVPATLLPISALLSFTCVTSGKAAHL